MNLFGLSRNFLAFAAVLWYHVREIQKIRRRVPYGKNYQLYH